MTEEADLVRFLRSCHEEMRFDERGLGFDEGSVIETLAMTTKNGGLLTLEFDEKGVSGCFAAAIVRNHMDYSQHRAVEFVWHARPDLSVRKRVETMKSLLAKAERWARKNHHYLVIATSERKPAMRRLLERSGFKPLETLYGKGF